MFGGSLSSAHARKICKVGIIVKLIIFSQMDMVDFLEKIHDGKMSALHLSYSQLCWLCIRPNKKIQLVSIPTRPLKKCLTQFYYYFHSIFKKIFLKILFCDCKTW